MYIYIYIYIYTYICIYIYIYVCLSHVYIYIYIYMIIIMIMISRAGRTGARTGILVKSYQNAVGHDTDLARDVLLLFFFAQS